MMEIKINVPDYLKESGLSFQWEDNFLIESHIEKKSIVITANKAGLISLARHLLMLAQDDVSVGNHFHLDDSNSLEEGSVELIFLKGHEKK